ncbi:hypothetical protein K6U15_12815, partial [Vibrio parahaemolyticus]|uniref:hypothetical protein n=1 Tax=Vibrio parahaemolyticus TaxID=670 RepID=UPI001EEC8373|nr:hypothetical protein [Vibrio parahaemolyticus]
MVIRSTASFAETPIAVNPLHSRSPKLELHLKSVENNVEQMTLTGHKQFFGSLTTLFLPLTV